MKNKFWFTFFFLSIFVQGYSEINSSLDLKRRAVLFFQANSIELHIADVDAKENKLIHTVFIASEKVAFEEDFNKNRRASIFSTGIQDKALNSLKKLIKNAEPISTTSIQGFAIDVFREAKNSQDLFKRIKDEAKIDVSILSDEQEGIVEFISLMNELKMNPEKTLTCYMGWKLFRLTAKCEENYSVFIGKIHLKLFSDVVNFLEKKIQNTGGYSITPLTEEDLKQEMLIVKGLLKDIPQCIRDKATDSETTILGFGENQPKILMDDRKEISLHTAQEALKTRIGKWDEASKSKDLATYPAAMLRNVYGFALADLILFSGVMDALHIQNIKVISTKPNLTVGCLLYPKFWK